MVVEAQTPPLVIIALDGADPELVERWVQQGSLPTIASIRKRGSWAGIAGSQRVCYFGSWLSLFSRLTHDQHGHYDFRPLVPGTNDLRIVTPRDAAAPDGLTGHVLEYFRPDPAR